MFENVFSVILLIVTISAITLSFEGCDQMNQQRREQFILDSISLENGIVD